MDKLKTLGGRVKYARIKKGYERPSTFANLHGITPSNMFCFEQNKTVPNCKNIVTLSLALNVSVDWLLTGKGERVLKQDKINYLQFHKKMVGKRIKSARLKKGYKWHTVFSKATGIPKSTIGDYERGVSLPSSRALKSLANSLDVTVDWLLFGNIKQLKKVINL